MAQLTSREIQLVSRPNGIPTAANFALVQSTLPQEAKAGCPSSRLFEHDHYPMAANQRNRGVQP